jgi:hypothetical protein
MADLRASMVGGALWGTCLRCWGAREGHFADTKDEGPKFWAACSLTQGLARVGVRVHVSFRRPITSLYSMRVFGT